VSGRRSQDQRPVGELLLAPAPERFDQMMAPRLRRTFERGCVPRDDGLRPESALTALRGLEESV